MKIEDITKDLRNKNYYPVYFLMGEEPFFIDVISNYIEKNVLTESEKEFNQTILYGENVDFKTLISNARRYPVMADYQVIIVREAQNMEHNSGRFAEMLDNYLDYFENPQQTTILVFCYKYKKIDARKKAAKAISKNGILFESKKIYDDKLPGWISDYVKRKGYLIDPVATRLLADYLGNDLAKIVNEVGKLFISLDKGSKINTEIIEKNIGISKEYNIFEFQNALGKKDEQKAFRIVHYFESNPKNNPFVFILAMLYNFFSKILIYHSLKDKSDKNAASELSVPVFFVKDYKRAASNYSYKSTIQIFSYLREYDLKSKGIGNISFSEGELLKELTYKILHRS